MQLRYNYRAYLTAAERSAAGRALGCVRVVWNDALAHRRAAHEAGEKYPADAEMSARLAKSKETPQRAWLNEVSAVVLQQSLADLNKAYRAFFNSLSGKRKGPKVEAPGSSHARTRGSRCGSPPTAGSRSWRTGG